MFPQVALATGSQRAVSAEQCSSLAHPASPPQIGSQWAVSAWYIVPGAQVERTHMPSTH